MNGLSIRAVSRHSRNFRLRNVRRHLHTAKALPYPIEEGLGDFLPPAALKALGVEYQQGLLERLSEQVHGTELANKSVVQTIIDTAPDRSKTLAFNYASQALNNSFFLDTLKPPPANAFNNEADISMPLGMAIRQDFGSLEQLKSTVSAAAMGMSSSGWIWVAVDGRATMGVIPTFGAGTLLVRSRGRVMQSSDPVLGEDYPTPTNRTTPPHQSTPSSSTSGLNAPQPTATRGFHTSAHAESIYGGKAVGLYGRDVDGEAFEGEVPTADFEKIGTNLYPLFCLSVHEHAWLTAGYGIWGKEEYLKRFWTVLDWKKVSDAFNLFALRRAGN
ncbi:manganese and iron superoxide dismutase [Thelephora ganbajun]|uniref:Manganese and iron superoxide dismutase n=1 Tax=Thelephora ganbajun TaxID=370292 RepID=A0ACB6ZIE2_THEGA|nr:manganese and iron superoxide dismutase [Thelephora ganbajun]